MATSSSSSESQESGLAPTDFTIAASLDDSTYSLNFTSERCPLCYRTKTPLLCGSCVKNGEFFHSKTAIPQVCDSFRSKQERLHQLEEEHRELSHKFEEAMCNRMRVIKKRSQLLMAKENVNHLRRAVSSLTEKIEKDRSKIASEQESNSAKAAYNRKHSDKMARICRYIELTKTYTQKQSQVLEDKMTEVMSVRRELISLIVLHIFPLTETRPKPESTDSMVMSTVSALAEARRMSYVGGRWVYMENGSDIKYTIVEPSLPGNGDYSVFNMFKSSRPPVSEEESESDVTERSPAHTVGAALSLTTQLVNILASVLDVHLPKRLCYSEFRGDDLIESKFANVVLKLNQNVLTLCASQHVPAESVHPQHTLHNVAQLLSARQLGRSQYYEFEADRMQASMDDLYFTYSDSDSDQDEDRDWESVPSNLPEVEVPSGSYTSQGSDLYSSDQQMPGGFVSSAAAFGASLWRAATGQAGQPQDKR